MFFEILALYLYHKKNKNMENLITYKTNSDLSTDILFDSTKITSVNMSKTEVEIFIDSVNEFILDFTEGGNIVEVKSDDGNFGLIVDIWEDFRYDDIVESAVFYFEDFCLV